jgi:hypothetical protein
MTLPLRSRRHAARAFRAAIAIATVVVLPLVAQVQERVDLQAVQLIKEEAQQRSRVMEFASYLTDVYGPRLTNSPQMRKAADYVKQQYVAMGLANPRFESWGPFGRGWQNDRTSVHVTSPAPWAVVAFPKAWTPGTNGPVTGPATLVRITGKEDFTKYRGRLEGKFALVSDARDVRLMLDAPGRRLTDEDLSRLTEESAAPRRNRPAQANTESLRSFRAERMAFYKAEGVLALLEISPGDRGDNGALRVQQPAAGEGSRDPADPAVLPQLVLSAEHYGRLVRMLEKEIAVTLEADVRNSFFDDDQNSFNILADIPGTDRAAQVVMLGAHFDSWHTGTGATDNAGSCAVVMEAMRILKATGLPLRRTVRAALWTGEEQGLLGSRAYVREHFGDSRTMQLKPEHARLSAYFNMDNGGGEFRGLYLQRNEMVAPIFKAWIEPFRSYGMTTLSIRSTGSSDHVPFDEIGLPAFQFIQDPLEYDRRSHHTNLDQYERLVPEDLVKNASEMAAFVYHAANRDELIPRKPLPERPSPRGPTAVAADR